MINIDVDPLLALFLYPFLGTSILAAVINLVGREASHKILISASTGIGTVWVCAFVLGIPSFSLAFESSSIAHVLLAGLFIGTLLDHFLPQINLSPRVISSTLDLTFLALIILWVRAEIDFQAIIVFIIWGSILVNSRRHTHNSDIPFVMILLAAIGLAAIAWIGDFLLDRNLAIGIGSTVLGVVPWHLQNRDLPIGFSFYWSTFTALLLIALRIIETNPLMAIPTMLLGFIFFSDSILSRMNIRYKSFENIAKLAVVGALSLIPIVLASVSALVATTLFNY